MRDYQFGEWLSTLRISSGYSQFQLGRLLGVSDKAVSKWETGVAKPRVSIYRKLADIFGISLEELMGVHQNHIVELNQSDQFTEEETLWQRAKAKLVEVYGSSPPLAFRSRLNAEEMLFRGTGMIEHVMLKATLRQRGILCEDWMTHETNLISWLLGASPVNPLLPHTVCPSCKRTVLHQEVRDGWDLPGERCSCGTQLVRDGHSIPLSHIEKRFAQMDRRMILHVYEGDELIVRESIREQYQDRWKLTELVPTEQDEALAKIFQEPARNFLLSPVNVKLPYPMVGDKCKRPDGIGPFAIMKIPEMLVYVSIHNWSIGGSEWSVNPEPGMDELLKAEILRKAFDLKRIAKGYTIGTRQGQTNQVIVDADYEDDLPTPFVQVMKRYPKEDIGAFLPDTLTFSSLMQLCTPGFALFWHRFAGPLVKEKRATLDNIPMSWEDLFNLIKLRMIEIGIQDDGIALKALASLDNKELAEEIDSALSEMGFETWLPDYLTYLRKYGSFWDLPGKEQLVLAALRTLLRAYDPQKWEQRWIDENETEK